MADKTIGGRYTMQRVLGSGGMGTVYLCTDITLQQQVAVKALKTEVATPELIQRFKREGQALRDLNHPNIVKMLDAIEADGKHYLVMEYVGGGDLKSLIEKEGKLDHKRCVDLAIDLADALTRAHRLNIIHRDLKPANVLIGTDGVLRLTDFGVAHMVNKDRMTDTDAVIGTVDYLPPEALNGEPIDARADIWAFGVMLFEMLTGQRPFQGDNLSATITAILTGPLPDFDSMAVDVPTPLQDLIYRMLERGPQVRIPSVRIIGAELEAILVGRDNTPAPRRFETETLVDTALRPKHNLPALATPFIGREHELIGVARLLDAPDLRLVTILAPGGMGKTRLSLAAAEKQIDSFKDGVYFVELAPLNDPDHIVLAIARAVGYQFPSDNREAEQQLADFLSNKAMLLVLDNFDHLLEKATLVTEILKSAPNIKILATSRQRLNQPGEVLFHLSGMDFPDWETPEDALEYAAVRLYQGGAKRANPNFALSADNLQYVARICRLVEGMPLGIVLAASWQAMLTTEEIAAEIENNMNFLESTGDDIPDRQRSIQAVFDHSWQMLTEQEQIVFMKLSYFRGGFSREAAQEIADATLRQLISLVNKSLLRRDVNTGRYDIHALLRQFVAQKSDMHSDMMLNIYKAHADFYVKLCEKLEPDTFSSGQIAAINQLELDLENFRIAVNWLFQSKNYDDILRIGSLWSFWHIRGHVKEVYQWLTAALNHVTDSTSVKAKGFLAASYLSWVRGDLAQAKTFNDQSLAIFRQQADQMGISSASAFEGFYLWWGGEPQAARQVLEFSTNLCREVGNDWYLAFGLYWLAHTYFEEQDITKLQKDLSKPRSMLHECEAVARRVGERQIRAFAAEGLGHVAMKGGDFDTARRLYLEAWKFREELGDKWMIAWTLRNLSVVSEQVGNYVEQKSFIMRELALFTDLGVDWVIEDSQKRLQRVENLLGNT